MRKKETTMRKKRDYEEKEEIQKREKRDYDKKEERL